MNINKNDQQRKEQSHNQANMILYRFCHLQANSNHRDVAKQLSVLQDCHLVVNSTHRYKRRAPEGQLSLHSLLRGFLLQAGDDVLRRVFCIILFWFS